MSIMHLATLALATGFAAAGPIAAPVTKRDNIFGNGFNGAVLNGFSGNGFNFADGFNNFNQQQQVIQVQQENLRIDINDNGRQQQIVQQVNQVLVVDQVNNGFNNDLNNLFRKSNMQNQFRDKATVMLVVQEIQIAVDDGRGNQVQQQIFAQSAVVANRGARETQTVMIFDQRTLIAQDVLKGNAFQNIGQFNGVAGAKDGKQLNAAIPTKTQGVQLFGAKPTWDAVAEDPAANLGGIWQGAIEDLQKNDNDQQDMQLNAEIAKMEMQKLEEAAKGQDDAAKQQEEAQKAADEAAKQQQDDAAKQAEQQKADEAAKAADAQKAADEAAKKNATAPQA